MTKKTSKKFIKKTFSERLKYSREELRRLTQARLAEIAGLPATSISHFENIKATRKPSLNNLLLLANALEVTTDYLLGRTNQPSGFAVDELHLNIQELSMAKKQIAMKLIKCLLKEG